MYATWNLSQTPDGSYSGPQNLIVQAGAEIETIYVTPTPEIYLSKITGNISELDLSQWNFEVFTSELARQFIELNFLPELPREGFSLEPHFGRPSLEDILSKITPEN